MNKLEKINKRLIPLLNLMAAEELGKKLRRKRMPVHGKWLWQYYRDGILKRLKQIKEGSK